MSQIAAELTASDLKIPQAARAHFDAVIAHTDAICALHLDAEYAMLARRAAAGLSRKRPCPLASGQAKTWAGGILYMLGQMNWLSDKAQTPNMSMAELCKRCGIGASSGTNKAAEIRKLLAIRMFDHRWMRRSLLDQHPAIWMIQVNGFIMDARQLPVEVQEEAVARGMIPYVVPPEQAAA